MFTQTLGQSPQDRRGGKVSYLLLGDLGPLSSKQLAVTWVVGDPDSEQSPHRHDHSEQVYVIVSGRGLMTVADEHQEVDAGTLVLIPPGESHFIRNIDQEPLVYVSATSPPFDIPPGGWAYPADERNDES